MINAKCTIICKLYSLFINSKSKIDNDIKLLLVIQVHPIILKMLNCPHMSNQTVSQLESQFQNSCMNVN